MSNSLQIASTSTSAFENSISNKNEDNNIASNTTQNKGYSLGKGEDGRPFSATPSSGAGGGYYGGYAVNGIVAPTYLAVSSSGSSYVSGYNGCKANNQFIFRQFKIYIL